MSTKIDNIYYHQEATIQPQFLIIFFIKLICWQLYTHYPSVSLLSIIQWAKCDLRYRGIVLGKTCLSFHVILQRWASNSSTSYTRVLPNSATSNNSLFLTKTKMFQIKFIQCLMGYTLSGKILIMESLLWSYQGYLRFLYVLKSENYLGSQS
jgi:hypothetical protein